MFGVGVGVRVGGFTASSGGGFDPDAQAFFDRVTTAGGTLSETEKTATNTLVVSMKADGVWSSMKAIYPMVGASAAACAQNLKSASFTGTFTSGWTFASTGVTPNGTSAYMNTTLTPNGNLTNNSTHLSFYSRTNVDATPGGDIGASGPGATFLPIALIYTRASDVFIASIYDYNVVKRVSTSNTNSLGFYVGNRTSNIVLNCWKNGTKQATNTTLETLDITTVTNSFFVSAINLGGSAGQFSNRECAFSSIGDGLTDTQASNLYTAVQAFQTTLSRNV
jgi:hypothetical protein